MGWIRHEILTRGKLLIQDSGEGVYLARVPVTDKLDWDSRE